ncbi:MAG: response regulator [Myxococcota bacterium]|nr:response regulator [Myxococcota bacterium]
MTTPTDAQNAGTKTILVVDDFQDNRAMYAEFLRYSGFGVAEAANGLEAIQQAASVLPDVIVMDLSLPVLDGWEATRRLKLDAATRHIPIIALTGHALPAHLEEARQAGCDRVLSKPCLPQDLLDAIHGLIAPATGPLPDGIAAPSAERVDSGPPR